MIIVIVALELDLWEISLWFSTTYPNIDGDPTVSTRYTYDGQDVMLDDMYNEDEGVSRGGFGPPPHTFTKYLNGPGMDNKLRLTTSTGSTVSDDEYFQADHLGSTNGLTSPFGTLSASNSYDSFGNATNGSFTTRYQFTGREFDNFTGLQYSRARFYDPTLGRFISEDPIGFRGRDINLYGYVRNDPAMSTDPTGKSPLLVVAIVGGAIAAELAIHYGLAEYADHIKFSDPDAFGRKRHCWVNCMSTRIHLGNPAVVGGLGSLKEIHDLYVTGNLSDSIGDIQANSDGMMKAFIVWRGCQALCDECKF